MNNLSRVRHESPRRNIDSIDAMSALVACAFMDMAQSRQCMLAWDVEGAYFQAYAIGEWTDDDMEMAGELLSAKIGRKVICRIIRR